MADGAIRPTPENLPDDITTQKRIIAEMARDAATARAEIARLKFQLARYRRASSADLQRSWRARASSSSWRALGHAVESHPTQRNRWFADSLLERDGFEPSVPREI
jgi:hypothetical protein